METAGIRGGCPGCGSGAEGGQACRVSDAGKEKSGCQTACGGCCGGCSVCRETSDTRIWWDYDDTVLVYSSDMLEDE